MSIINIKQTFKNLKGIIITVKGDEEEASTKPEEKEPLTLGQVLADILINSHSIKKGFRPLKSYELAKKFYGENAKKDEVEIELAELIQIRELVEENPFYNTVITAQALEMLK
jgi:hypothetical protein